MMQILEGSQAVSYAVRLARTKVISAYPITPQTHIVEELAKYCADGSLDGRFICVESEHSAMAAVIGAASGGVRTFTASSSHGLALMHEMLHWASSARLPIVMSEVNRALGPGWNLWLDQTDSLSQRDTGWIQIYCEDAQDAFDSTLQAFLLAELANLPVMVVMDAFFLSHTYEPVDIPDQAAVDRFLPAYEPKFMMDTAAPCSLHEMAPPNVYMEMRRSTQLAMEMVPELYKAVTTDFASIFGREHSIVDSFMCEDAEVVLAMAGTTASTCRQLVMDLRAKGEKIGLLSIKMFRPFPVRQVRELLKGRPKLAVIDRNCSFGAGGIFAQELRAALMGMQAAPMVYSYIAGLGGRDVKMETLEDIYRKTRKAAAPEIDSLWIECDEALARTT